MARIWQDGCWGDPTRPAGKGRRLLGVGRERMECRSVSGPEHSFWREVCHKGEQRSGVLSEREEEGLGRVWLPVLAQVSVGEDEQAYGVLMC